MGKKSYLDTLLNGGSNGKKSGSGNRGSTMYGRNYGSSKTPIGASGGFNVRTGKGHSTQFYDDNTRQSWNTDGNGDSNRHWTNQNKAKGSPGRHQPPKHAR